MSLKSFGRSRARRPDVDSAAQAGFPVAYMATRQDRDGCSIRTFVTNATIAGQRQPEGRFRRGENVGNAAE
jgi:hypothetical protein